MVIGLLRPDRRPARAQLRTSGAERSFAAQHRYAVIASYRTSFSSMPSWSWGYTEIQLEQLERQSPLVF